MNGPFQIGDYGAFVVDEDGNRIATADGSDEVEERRNAQIICDALNAVFYAQRAASLIR